jgi:hypothetical protein
MLNVEWDYTIREELHLPHVADDEWVRLVPISGPELASGTSESQTWDRRGRPKFSPSHLTVDRKLVADFDLMDSTFGPVVLASERFVAALSAERVPHWRASIIRHVTPNSVAGHRVFALSVDGWIGPFIDTKLEYSEPHSKYADEQPNGLPHDPVTFDGTRGTAFELAWSSWCGVYESRWRALICRGRLLRKLNARLGPLRCGVVPVHVRGWRSETPSSGPGRVVEDDPPPREWNAAEVAARIRSGASRFKHELAKGTDRQKLAATLQSLGLTNPDEVAPLLAPLVGAKLFGGLLCPFMPSKDVDAQRPQDLGAPLECYKLAPDAIAFTQSIDYVLYALTPDGRVRGYGHDGGIYGPDAPFVAWLGDQVADLEFARKHPHRSAWTEHALHL